VVLLSLKALKEGGLLRLSWRLVLLSTFVGMVWLLRVWPKERAVVFEIDECRTTRLSSPQAHGWGRASSCLDSEGVLLYPGAAHPRPSLPGWSMPVCMG